MNEVKKVILFLLCCAIPFSFYAQKARQNAVHSSMTVSYASTPRSVSVRNQRVCRRRIV